jgi:hypothetical protein
MYSLPTSLESLKNSIWTQIWSRTIEERVILKQDQVEVDCLVYNYIIHQHNIGQECMTFMNSFPTSVVPPVGIWLTREWPRFGLDNRRKGSLQDQVEIVTLVHNASIWDREKVYRIHVLTSYICEATSWLFVNYSSTQHLVVPGLKPAIVTACKPSLKTRASKSIPNCLHYIFNIDSLFQHYITSQYSGSYTMEIEVAVLVVNE